MTTVTIPTTTVAVADSGVDVALTIGAATTTVTATGGAGPANSLAIGSVTAGTAAAATITGTPPSQTLDLTLPGAAWGAITGTLADQTDLGVALASKAAIAPSLYMWPMVSDAYSSTQATTSQASFTEAREFTAALFMPDRDCTITKIACEVGTTAGSSGAVIRLGLRAYNATTNKPGNLIVDAGTVDATTAGVKEATISQALTKGTPYVITITTQGGAATKPNLIRSLFVSYPYAGNSTSGSIVFYKTGVTGALDNTGSWTVANGTSAKVWVYTT